jgi:hypothetical protein
MRFPQADDIIKFQVGQHRGHYNMGWYNASRRMI